MYVSMFVSQGGRAGGSPEAASTGCSWLFIKVLVADDVFIPVTALGLRVID